MKFTIALTELESLLKSAGISRPKAADTFTLFACAARVFVEFKTGIAGIESLVLSDGAVKLPVRKFIALLKTYKGTKLLTFDYGPEGLRIQKFTMPVLGYNPNPKPPADFQVFPTAGAPASVQSSRESNG